MAEVETALREKGGVLEWSTSRRPLSPITGRTSPLQLKDGHSLGEGAGSDNGEAARSSLSLRPSRQSTQEQESRASVASSSSSSHGDTPPSSDLMAAKRAALRAGESGSFASLAVHLPCVAALHTERSKARQEAFDMFRKEIADFSVIDQHKKVLKAK